MPAFIPNSLSGGDWGWGGTQGTITKQKKYIMTKVQQISF